MVLQQLKRSRAAAVSATITHLLAWAAFLWLALWPFSYQGISAAAVSVDGGGATTTEVARYSASLTEVNGYWVLLPLSAPVLVTGLALMSLLIWKGNGGRAANTLILGGLSVVLLIFSVLGLLSIGLFYLPVAIGSIMTTIIFGFRPGLPRPNDE